MSGGSETRVIDCPECGRAEAFVRIPVGATITDERSADGSAPATCLACGADFSAYYRQEY